MLRKCNKVHRIVIQYRIRESRSTKHQANSRITSVFTSARAQWIHQLIRWIWLKIWINWIMNCCKPPEREQCELDTSIIRILKSKISRSSKRTWTLEPWEIPYKVQVSYHFYINILQNRSLLNIHWFVAFYHTLYFNLAGQFNNFYATQSNVTPTGIPQNDADYMDPRAQTQPRNDMLGLTPNKFDSSENHMSLMTPNNMSLTSPSNIREKKGGMTTASNVDTACNTLTPIGHEKEEKDLSTITPNDD